MNTFDLLDVGIPAQNSPRTQLVLPSAQLIHQPTLGI
jgi:hypothetical protein